MRFRIFTLLAGIQAAAAGVYMFLLPADPKNDFLWGFSLYRLLVMAVLLAAALFFVLLSFWNIKDWPEWIGQQIKNKPASIRILNNILGSIAALGVVLCIAPALNPIPDYTAIYERLLPLMAWGTLVCFEALIVLILELCRLNGITLKDYLTKNWLGDVSEHKDEAAQNGRSAVILTALLTLAVLAPSSNANLFSGLPLSTLPDGIALFLLMPLWFSRRLRKFFFNRLERGHAAVNALMMATLVLVVILKSVLFFSNQSQGFQACYRSLANMPSEILCEKSFENPLFRDHVTRVDQSIYFDQNNWNFSFLNANRYDTFMPGNLDRERFPFEVLWTGNTQIEQQTQLRVDYIGEAEIQIGEASYSLAPNYFEVRQVDFDIPAGIEPVRIKYTFNDHYHIGDASVPGQDAVFKLSTVSANQKIQVLGGVNLSMPWNLMTWGADGLLLLMLALLAGFYGQKLFPAWRALVTFSLAALVIYWGLPELNFMWLMLLVFTWLLCWRGSEKKLVAYLLLGITLWCRVLVYLPTPEYNLLRFGGTDMLVYEGFARQIFESGSLEAGEKIFYFQAAFRYIVFLLHLVFGESDSIRSFFVLLALNLGLFLNIQTLAVRRKTQSGAFRGLGWLLTWMIVLLTNASLVFYVQHGISETISWICLLFVFYIYMVYAETLWPLAACLIGVAIINRYNHLPAMAFLFLFFNIPDWQSRKKRIIISLLIIGAILALIPIHNMVYGGKFEIMPISADANVNLILPPQTLLAFFSDPQVPQLVFNQIRILFGFVSWKMLDLCIPIFVLWMLWWILGGMLLVRRKQFSAAARWIWLLPGIYFGVQFFFYMLANYPRHLYAAYLAIALSGVYITWYSIKRSQREQSNLLDENSK